MAFRRPYAQTVGPNFPKQCASEVFPPFVGTISGEVAGSVRGMPLGMARFPGKVTGVYMSVKGCGKRDTSVYISGEVDVKINGTSCLTTSPRIGVKSGEVSAQKTTFPSASDVAVIASALDHSNIDFNEGDVFEWDFIYYGETSPATKMNGICVIVEVEPSY